MINFVENHVVTYFCHLCEFLMGLIDKPKLYTKFDIASFSHCTNIKGKPQMFGSSLKEAHAHFCFQRDFIIGLRKLDTKFDVASFSHYRNTKRGPKLCGASTAQSYAHFLGVIL